MIMHDLVLTYQDDISVVVTLIFMPDFSCVILISIILLFFHFYHFFLAFYSCIN